VRTVGRLMSISAETTFDAMEPLRLDQDDTLTRPGDLGLQWEKIRPSRATAPSGRHTEGIVARRDGCLAVYDLVAPLTLPFSCLQAEAATNAGRKKAILEWDPYFASINLRPRRWVNVTNTPDPAHHPGEVTAAQGKAPTLF
jgi:hypothetical protein